MGLGFEIIWPRKPDCEQSAMYGLENLGQFRLTVLAGAIPACSSFELLQNIRVNNDIGNPTVSHVTLHIKFDNVFLPVLHIPKPEIKHYALKPYKWLRFLGFILCGNTQPGSIAVSENEEPISEETIIGDELEHSDVYYIPSGMLQCL